MAPQSHALVEQPLELRKELIRKALHLSASIFPVLYYNGLSQQALVKLLAGAVLAAGVVEMLRRGSDQANDLYERLFGSLQRPAERESLTGATWLALSCMLAVAVLSKNAAIASLWCATVGDPAATIAGRLWSRRRDPSSERQRAKTIVGSIACAFVSGVGAIVFAGYGLVAACVIAIAAAAAESAPSAIDDNIRVAAAAGIVGQLLS